MSRAIGALAGATAGNPHLQDLLDHCGGVIAAAVGCDGIFLSTADPVTYQFSTLTHVREMPPEMCAPFMHNEFLDDDVNKFAHLSGSGVHVGTLADATFGQVLLSRRYRDIYRPHGFGPELRALLSDGRSCWGYLTLLRGADAPDYSLDDVAVIERMVEPLAVTFRDSLRWPRDTRPRISQPGTITVDLAGTFVSVSDRAKDALDLICAAPVHSVAASTLAHSRGRHAPQPKARLRGSDGTWFTIRGDTVRDTEGRASHASVVIESAPSAHVATIIARACCLSGREETVLGHLARGEGTRDIARALSISPHTVRDHVKGIFDKTGCRSRGELMHRFFALDP